MSLSAAALQLLLDKGLTLADAIELADTIEQGMAAPVPVLSKGALRTRKWREREEAKRHRDVTETRHGDVSHVGEPTRVVGLTSSLRSEGNPLTHPSGAPPKPKPSRSRRAPETWAPDEPQMARLLGDGFTAGEIERELAKFRDHEYRDPRSDWPAAFRNWLRRSRDFKPNAQRPRTDHRLDAFRDKLLDVGAAMDAAFVQPRRDN